VDRAGAPWQLVASWWLNSGLITNPWMACTAVGVRVGSRCVTAHSACRDATLMRLGLMAGALNQLFETPLPGWSAVYLPRAPKITRGPPVRQVGISQAARPLRNANARPHWPTVDEPSQKRFFEAFRTRYNRHAGCRIGLSWRRQGTASANRAHTAVDKGQWQQLPKLSEESRASPPEYG